MLLGRTEPAAIRSPAETVYGVKHEERIMARIDTPWQAEFNQEDKKRILRWTLDPSMGSVCDASWLATARPEREKRSLSAALHNYGDVFVFDTAPRPAHRGETPGKIRNPGATGDFRIP
jgi:hypothetical protein